MDEPKLDLEKPAPRNGKKDPWPWEDILPVGIFVGILVSAAFAVVTVTLRVAGVISWSWWTILSPVLFWAGLFLLFCLVIGFVMVVRAPRWLQ